jgi:putative ABC transport system substrate-binding protein
MSLGRREFIALVAGAAWPIATRAKHPMKVARIGYLGPSIAAHLAAFRQGLAELGWVEATTIIIEIRLGKYEQFPALAAELVRLNLDLIFAATTPGAQLPSKPLLRFPLL